jgi:hypothetical protein
MPHTLSPIQVDCSPTCEVCGVTMRLYGIEPHPTLNHTDLRTYVCSHCEEVQTAAVSSVPHLLPGGAFDTQATRLISATFDAIWDAVLASDGSAGDAQRRDAAREMLARCIIKIIQLGETNPDHIAEQALRNTCEYLRTENAVAH